MVHYVNLCQTQVWLHFRQRNCGSEKAWPDGCWPVSWLRTRSRRAQWKAEATGLVNVSVAGRQHKVPRRLLKAARLGLIDLDKR